MAIISLKVYNLKFLSQFRFQFSRINIDQIEVFVEV